MQFKVILVKQTTQELEKLLSIGWRVANAFQHPGGSLLILGKQTVPSVKRNK